MSYEILREETIKGTKIEMVKTNNGQYEELIIRMYYKKDGKNFVKNIENYYRDFKPYFTDYNECSKVYGDTSQSLKLGIYK